MSFIQNHPNIPTSLDQNAFFKTNPSWVLEPVEFEGGKERHSPAMYTDNYLLVAFKPRFKSIIGVHERNEQPYHFVPESYISYEDNTPWYYWGYIELYGVLKIPPIYRDALAFSEGLAAVRLRETNWGYIDTFGQLKIPFRYHTAGFFSEGLAAVEIDGRVGYINRLGQWVLRPRFFWGGSFRHGRAIVVVDYEENLRSRGPLGPFSEPKFAVINRQGRILKRFQNDFYKLRQDWPQWFSRSMLQPFSKKGKFGYKNRQGTIVIPARYEYALPFAEGLGPVNCVQGDGLSEYINEGGEVVFVVPYEPPRRFHNGRVFLFDDENGRWAIYDRNGRCVTSSLKFCMPNDFYETVAQCPIHAIFEDNQETAFDLNSCIP